MTNPSNITLHPLTEADRDLILPWHNAPEVRRNMYSHHEISPAEHRDWFERMKRDPSVRWYLCLDAGSDPVGVVYFTGVDRIQKTSFWGFYAKPGATLGTGIRMEYAALEFAFNDLSLHKLNCEVLATNTAVLNLHMKCGFTKEGVFRDQHFNGERYVDVIRLGLLSAEWTAQRDTLRERISELDALASTRRHSPGRRTIMVLSDENSWINDYVTDLLTDWAELGHDARWGHEIDDASGGDFCFCIGFGKYVPGRIRRKFHHTLVVHESALPLGKGWSPLTWQILEGRNRIPVTLIEAADEIDSGVIYAQTWIDFDGHELVEELRAAQASMTRELCQWFVTKFPSSATQAKPQTRHDSHYSPRGPDDSRLDPNKSISEQFNLLRVVDNDNYPAFFEWMGHRYQVAISKDRAKS